MNKWPLSVRLLARKGKNARLPVQSSFHDFISLPDPIIVAAAKIHPSVTHSRRPSQPTDDDCHISFVPRAIKTRTIQIVHLYHILNTCIKLNNFARQHSTKGRQYRQRPVLIKPWQGLLVVRDDEEKWEVELHTRKWKGPSGGWRLSVACIPFVGNRWSISDFDRLPCCLNFLLIVGRIDRSKFQHNRLRMERGPKGGRAGSNLPATTHSIAAFAHC